MSKMSKDVKKKCQRMSRNVYKCHKMSKDDKNVKKFWKNKKCQKMSKDVKKYQKMSKDVKNVKKKSQKIQKCQK